MEASNLGDQWLIYITILAHNHPDNQTENHTNKQTRKSAMKEQTNECTRDSHPVSRR